MLYINIELSPLDDMINQTVNHDRIQVCPGVRENPMCNQTKLEC